MFYLKLFFINNKNKYLFKYLFLKKLNKIFLMQNDRQLILTVTQYSYNLIEKIIKILCVFFRIKIYNM